MTPRRLGPWTVSPIGLGCMNLSHAYGTPPSTEDGRKVVQAALDAGVTLFDTAALYGFGLNEELVGPVLKPHRDRITLCSKGGLVGEPGPDGVKKRVIDGRPESLRRHCELSLKRLGTEVIDLYYLHRWDKSVPIEDSVGEMARLKAEGKIRALGLSEVGADALRRAHAVHPITALQTEYSLWSRNPEIAVLQACRELGVAFVAFSPVARAFLTGKLRDVSTLGDKDIRRAMPRFSAANYARNLELLVPYEALAARVGCTPAQLAIAWLLARGDDILPIPGTSRVDHLQEDLGAWDVSLDTSVMAELEALFRPEAITGQRYAPQPQREVDTEMFPGDAHPPA